jgi:hypothetical protein
MLRKLFTWLFPSKQFYPEPKVFESQNTQSETIPQDVPLETTPESKSKKKRKPSVKTKKLKRG